MAEREVRPGSGLPGLRGALTPYPALARFSRHNCFDAEIAAQRKRDNSVAAPAVSPTSRPRALRSLSSRRSPRLGALCVESASLPTLDARDDPQVVADPGQIPDREFLFGSEVRQRWHGEKAAGRVADQAGRQVQQQFIDEPRRQQ